MKSKQFDYYSFKAPSSQHSESQIPMEDIPMPQPQKIIRATDINFRNPALQPKVTPQLSIFDQNINTKIVNLNEQLESNIKRRMELESKLQLFQKQKKREEERQIFMAYNHNLYKDTKEVATQFADLNRRVDKVDKMVSPARQPSPQEVRVRRIQKSKDTLLKDSQPEIIPITNKQKILIPIIQTLSSQKEKPLPVYTVPDQIKIQTLLRKTTFPQIPSGNLLQLCKQAQHLLAVHQPHSDIHYMLMVIYYHLQKYNKVRKHYEQILVFKVFSPKAHWIAAQAQFALQNWQMCLKLTQLCMQKLEDRFLPRFIYIKAKCYEQQGNYINSIVCFNQILKLKPKISQYYLERGILYYRIGYYKQSKQDFTMFGILNPQGQDFIKNKILTEKNQIRKKQYIAMLAKMY